jgi:hypothetical protein
MKKYATLLLLLTLAACGSNPAPQTDPTRNLSATGHAAYDSMRIMKALDAVRDVANEAEKNKLISAANALKVIDYHKQVVKLMDVAPSGWRATAVTGLDQLQKDLTPAEWSQVAPFAAALKTYLTLTTPAEVQ